MTPRLRRKLVKMYKEIAIRHPDRLEQRAERAVRIAERQEGGEVAIVYGGVDCDGGRWDDCTAIVPATVVAVEHWLNDYYDGAEGPQWHRLSRPSSARELTRSSRDLALEAFEDGHAHVIYV